MNQSTLLQGRLGNQMFIYAYARALSLRIGGSCVLSEASLASHNITNRLGCFKLSPNVEFVKETPLNLLQHIGISFHARYVGNKARMEQHRLEQMCRKLFLSLGLFMCEDGYIEPVPASTKRNILNIGYFQSEKYFEKYKNIILDDLTFKDSIKKSCKDWADKIKSATEPTCLHVRLGDYVKNPLHGVADASYYRMALSELKKQKPNATIFVFSDNIEVVQKELRLVDAVNYIPSDFNDQQTMYLGSLCQNFVISNSSFSWWMQYLSRKEDRLVLAPSRWYAKPCPCDIYQDNWQLIEI